MGEYGYCATLSMYYSTLFALDAMPKGTRVLGGQSVLFGMTHAPVMIHKMDKLLRHIEVGNVQICRQGSKCISCKDTASINLKCIILITNLFVSSRYDC